MLGFSHFYRLNTLILGQFPCFSGIFHIKPFDRPIFLNYPENLQRAMRRLQSNKKDTVVFEDAFHAIQTAKAAGFRVAAVYDASEEAHQEEIRGLADYYIRSFEEMFETRELE